MIRKPALVDRAVTPTQKFLSTTQWGSHFFSRLIKLQNIFEFGSKRLNCSSTEGRVLTKLPYIVVLLTFMGSCGSDMLSVFFVSIGTSFTSGMIVLKLLLALSALPLVLLLDKEGVVLCVEDEATVAEFKFDGAVDDDGAIEAGATVFFFAALPEFLLLLLLLFCEAPFCRFCCC